MKKSLFLFLVISMSVFNSCSKGDSYLQLKESNLEGEALLRELNRFEKEHTEDFRSKIDLANYFIVVGDYNTCYEYLLRAESVIKNCPKGAEEKKYKTLLYGMRAQIELYSGNYESAHSYVDKAIELDKKANLKYNYTKAQIYVAQDDKEKALELFDKTYEAIPNELTSDDKRAYMYLLADAERFERCKLILEDFLDDGVYFFGLGTFASGVYEKNSEYEKALLSSYYDYEYYSCFHGLDKSAFFARLDSIVVGIKPPEKLFQIKDAIEFVKSRVDQSSENKYTAEFFPARFITLSNKIRDGKFTSLDVQNFLDLEIYFSNFPSYYWNAWNAFCQVDESKKKSYIPLLNKVVILGENNIYRESAKCELGKLAGLSKDNSKKILLPDEIMHILTAFNESLDESFLEPIYELLDLPENDYELHALAILRDCRSNLALMKKLEEKVETISDGVLCARLKYVLS